MPELWFWRHPRVPEAAGRCIGSTDLAVDRRRAKRLAHRIRATARRHALPRVLWVSPARRCRSVARMLARWGWQVRVDERLREMHFGGWEGRYWETIAAADVEAWSADLLNHRPGGGESLCVLAARAHAFVAAAAPSRAAAPPAPAAGVLLVLGHGGWINALRLVHLGTTHIDAASWPAPPKPGSLLKLSAPPGR